MYSCIWWYVEENMLYLLYEGAVTTMREFDENNVYIDNI